MSASWSIRLLGGFELKMATGQTVGISAKKNRALLAYLAMSNGRVRTRKELAALLWSERDSAHRRDSLRQAIVSIRRDLKGVPSSPLRLGIGGLMLDQRDCTIDVLAFERMASSMAIDDLKRASELYRGEFLEGLNVGDSAFEEWRSALAARLQDLALAALQRLLSQQGPEVIATAQRLLRVDQAHEGAHRALMTAYARRGDAERAMRQYESCRRALQRQRGVTPAEETVRLRDFIRANQRTNWAASPMHAPEAIDPSMPAGTLSEIAVALDLFEVPQDDPALRAISVGLTHDLSMALSRFPLLRVSVHKREGMPIVRSPADKVEYRISGRLFVLDRSPLLEVQLLECATSRQVWVGRVDAVQSKLTSLGDELFGRVAAILAKRIQDESCKAIESKPERDLSARECVLRALELTDQMGHNASNSRIQELSERAIRLDSRSGIAHALLACAKLREIDWCMPRNKACFGEVLELARKAVDLDERESLCQYALGWVHLQRNKFGPAEIHYNRVLRLNPHSPKNLTWMGAFLSRTGKVKRGIELLGHARAADPTFEATWHWNMLGLAQFNGRSYRKALAAFARSTDLPSWAWAITAACHAYRGDSRKAGAAREEAIRLQPAIHAEGVIRRQFSGDNDHLREGLRKAGMK